LWVSFIDLAQGTFKYSSILKKKSQNNAELQLGIIRWRQVCWQDTFRDEANTRKNMMMSIKSLGEYFVIGNFYLTPY